MSLAQLLIGVIGLGASISVFVLMRFPQHRREPYRGEPFSLAASLGVTVVVLALCLLFAWMQGQLESQPVPSTSWRTKEMCRPDANRIDVCHNPPPTARKSLIPKGEMSASMFTRVS